MEDLAYRRMLDAYYLREGQLPTDVSEVSRLIRLRDQAAIVRDVLNEFFEQTHDGWRHIRCDEEIAKMQDKQAKARSSAQASVNARRAKANPTLTEGLTNVEQTLNDRSTNVQLPTPTPTPTPTPSNTNICPPNGELEEKAGLPKCHHQAIVDLYHKHLPTLRRVEVWNDTRKGYLRQRWREVAEELAKDNKAEISDVLTWFTEFFDHIGQSKFLTGRVNSKDGRAFLADLEWILKPSNFAKIVEGKYHGAN